VSGPGVNKYGSPSAGLGNFSKRSVFGIWALPIYIP
jgi:hypothetical protein